MSNSIIPYEFIPGTKAKASEVNANFLAVSEAISSVSSSTSSLVEAVETKIDDLTPTLANVDLSNTNKFTNCILSASNGVASYSTNEITIKSELKVLIPDGLTGDKTLNNIELKLEENVIFVCTDAVEDEFYLLLYEDESVDNISTSTFFTVNTSDDLPELVLGENYMYYVKDKNYYYSSNNGSSYTTQSCIVIAKYSTSNDNLVTTLTAYSPIELLKKADTDWIIRQGLPDYDSGIDITSTWNTDKEYTPCVDGFLKGYTAGNTSFSVTLIPGATHYSDCIWTHNGETAVYITGMLSVQKNTTYYRAEEGTSYNTTQVVFYPIKGVN